jgi:hypothetical protein
LKTTSRPIAATSGSEISRKRAAARGLLVAPLLFGFAFHCRRSRAFDLYPIRRAPSDFLTRPFLNLAISELQETSHRPTHRWNVVSEQRKSNWQHPNTYYRERKKTKHSAADKCDTRRHPHPFRTLPTKAPQIMADLGRNVILEPVHFLVEIGNPLTQ